MLKEKEDTINSNGTHESNTVKAKQKAFALNKQTQVEFRVSTMELDIKA